VTYEVFVLPLAKQEIRDSAAWWAEHRSADEADSWLVDIQRVIATLTNNPARCPFARENPRCSVEVRHLLYGVGSRATHRIIFTIDEQEQQVLVHSVRHVSQNAAPELFD